MSASEGLSRPLRVAGIALIGVGIVAAGIGVATAFGGGNGDDNTASQTPPASVSTAPTSASPSASSVAPPSTTPPPASSSTPPTTTSPSSAPPASSGPSVVPPAEGENQNAAAKWVTVRVYNNSTIQGLAGKAAQDFRTDGWNVAEVSNYPSGVIPSTTAYFRPGTDEEPAAKTLAESFGMRAEPRFEGIEQSKPGLIVIVTNDYKGAGKTK